MNEDFIWPSDYDLSQDEGLERVCNELEAVQDKLEVANRFISNMGNYIEIAISYGGLFRQTEVGTWLCYAPNGQTCQGETKEEAAKAFCEQFEL